MDTVERWIHDIAGNFQYSGEMTDFVELTAGNINRTFCLSYQDGDKQIKYTLQRINTNVFLEPDLLMKNALVITEHIKSKLIGENIDPTRRVLSIVRTKDDKLLYRAKNQDCWRSFIYQDNAIAYQKVEDPQLLYEAGKTFGEFQKYLSDFDVSILHVPIPDFHNTKWRFKQLKDAVERDAAGAVSNIPDILKDLFDREERACSIMKMLDNGELPLRVTHNDTKLNNVLIDEETKKGICVIDLDTVMPGTSLFDFGDAIRFAANSTREDDPYIENVSLDMELFTLFTKGFVEAVYGFLDEKEIKLFPLGAWVMAVELSTRFLTDYINGNIYFKYKYMTHNLDRAYNQLALAMDMEKKWDDMDTVIKESIHNRG